MFRGLRLRLTLLYIVVALALILLLSLGTYRLISDYFQSTTDLALQHRMAHEFRLLGAPIPAELVAADRDWSANRGRLFPQIPSRAPANPANQPDATTPTPDQLRSDFWQNFYDGELSAIFVLPLNARGQLIFDPNPYAPPMMPDQAATQLALDTGKDWRTVQLANGTHVRLLTYRLTRLDGPAVLQLGRALLDQERVLNQLLTILLILGSSSAVLLGAGSWWLAGRSLAPAQQAWERQQAFVANASHELRTPLALIRASTEAALRKLPADQTRPHRLLNDVIDESDHMTRLVNDLLLLSRLDAGQIMPERMVIWLPDLLTAIQRQVGQLAADKQTRLSIQPSDQSAWGDPTRLRQVLLILLDNALQHTPAGGAIQLVTHSQGRYIAISVIDTGRGIAPEHLPHIFERFYRADSARASARGGAGLGLSIARALMELQQGSITIASEVGVGTQVTLTLPAAPGASHPAGDVPKP